jgi:hypothetical protein
MVEAVDPIYFTKLILKEVFTKTKMTPKKGLYKVWIQMVKFALYIMRMIIIFVQLATSSFQKADKTHLEHLNFLNYQTNKINFMWWLDNLPKCFLACTRLNGVKFKQIYKHIGLNFITFEEEKKEFSFIKGNKIKLAETIQSIALWHFRK